LPNSHLDSLDLMAITIRNGRLEDAADIVRLLEQLEYFGTSDFIDKRVTQLLSHSDALLLVATENTETIVGFVSAHFIPQLALAGDFCRISYLCVDQHSRSLGIGRQLEERVVELAKGRKCDRIEVHCHWRRDRAHRFYARQGYVENPKYLLKKLLQ
jgi:GNAT superfamily N-acetyltransferase